MQKIRLILRSDTTAEWLRIDPKPALNELVYDTDKRAFKRGDGLLPYSQLAYLVGREIELYGPYPSHAAAVAAIPQADRKAGLTVGITAGNGLVEEWWFPGPDFGNIGLIPKTPDLSGVLSGKEDKARKGAANGYGSLDGNGKQPLSEVPDALLGNVHFKGTYLFATNIVTSDVAALNGGPLPAATPANTGDYFIVKDSGVIGALSYGVGDWIISNGAAGYDKVDNTDAVLMVNGKIGAVVLTTDDIAEGSNVARRFFTEARALGAKLAGYSTAAVASVLDAGMSVLVALGVLEKRIDDNTTLLHQKVDWEFLAATPLYNFHEEVDASIFTNWRFSVVTVVPGKSHFITAAQFAAMSAQKTISINQNSITTGQAFALRLDANSIGSVRIRHGYNQNVLSVMQPGETLVFAMLPDQLNATSYDPLINSTGLRLMSRTGPMDIFLGDWNPNTNTPGLFSTVVASNTQKGGYYRVSEDSTVVITKVIALIGGGGSTGYVDYMLDRTMGILVGMYLRDDAYRTVTAVDVSTGVVRFYGNYIIEVGATITIVRDALGFAGLKQGETVYSNGTRWVRGNGERSVSTALWHKIDGTPNNQQRIFPGLIYYNATGAGRYLGVTQTWFHSGNVDFTQAWHWEAIGNNAYPIVLQTLAGPVGFASFDTALQTTSPYGSIGDISVATTTISVSNGHSQGKSSWPAFLNANGASIIVNDGVIVTLGYTAHDSLNITDAFFQRQNPATTGNIGVLLVNIGGLNGLSRAGRFTDCFSQIPVQMQGGELVLTNGSYTSVIGSGTIYLFGNVVVDLIAPTITVIDRRVGSFDLFQGDWNPNTNLPALVAGVGIRGQYYRVSATQTVMITTSGIPVPVTANGPVTSNVLQTQASGSTFVVGMTVTGAGIPAGTTLTSVTVATATTACSITLSVPVLLATQTQLQFQFPVLGLLGLLAGNELFFNGTAWINRLAVLPNATKGNIGAVRVGSGLQVENGNGIMHATSPDYYGENRLDENNGTGNFRTAQALLPDGYFSLPGAFSPSSLISLTGRVIGIRAVGADNYIGMGYNSMTSSNELFEGSSNIPLRNGEFMWFRRVATGWECVLDGRRHGLPGFRGDYDPVTNTPSLSYISGPQQAEYGIRKGDFYRISKTGITHRTTVTSLMTVTTIPNNGYPYEESSFTVANAENLRTGMMIDGNRIEVKAVVGNTITLFGDYRSYPGLNIGREIVFKSVLFLNAAYRLPPLYAWVYDSKSMLTDFVEGQYMQWNGTRYELITGASQVQGIVRRYEGTPNVQPAAVQGQIYQSNYFGAYRRLTPPNQPGEGFTLGPNGPNWEAIAAGTIRTFGADELVINTIVDFCGPYMVSFPLIDPAGIRFNSSSNRVAGAERVIRLIAGGAGSDQPLQFPASWAFQGFRPVSLAFGRTGLLRLFCFGPLESDVVAIYTVQP